MRLRPSAVSSPAIPWGRPSALAARRGHRRHRRAAAAARRGAARADPAHQDGGHLLRIDRLDQEVVHPRVHALAPVLLHRVGRHRHDRQQLQLVVLANLAGGGDAVHHRHLHVHEHQVVGESSAPAPARSRRSRPHPPPGPQSCSISRATCWLISLSSTSRMRAPRSAARRCVGAPAALAAAGAGLAAPRRPARPWWCRTGPRRSPA